MCACMCLGVRETEKMKSVHVCAHAGREGERGIS